MNRGREHLPKYHSGETKRKISESRKGEKNPLYGKHHSEETKRKISSALKGRNKSEEENKKNSESHKGKHQSEETRRKNSESHKGRIVSEETRKKMSKARKGEKCHLWRGGISFEPYTLDWTETLKRSIRERDKYICQLCGKLQSDRAFDIHHIDYDKENCNPNNLITLCSSCHKKTSFNREYWTEYFMEAMVILKVLGKI